MLGGLGIPNISHKVTAIRINYFLYNMRNPSQITTKLEISLIITQMEVGIFQQFLSQSFNKYGKFAALTLGTQMWKETEPFGLQLCAAPEAMWTHQPQGTGDIPIIDLAIQVYNQKGANMINRCRFYLNLISIYDLYVYDGSRIHPSYIHREYPPSRIPLAQWPSYPKPPKHYWILWNHFLHFHVPAYRSSIQFQWNTLSQPNYANIFFRHRQRLSIFRVVAEDVSEYNLLGTRQNKVFYESVPCLTSISPTDPDLYPVEIYTTLRGFQYIMKTNINSHAGERQAPPSPTLADMFRALPESLQILCGRVTFPPDDGNRLLATIESSYGCLYGDSDASLKRSTSAHSWFISSGNIDDIEDPYLHISGSGPVDGYAQHLSSTRGERQGQVAIAVIANLLLKFHKSNAPLKIISDSKNYHDDPNLDCIHRLRTHRTPDMVLRLQMRQETKELTLHREWVKGHQDNKP